MYWETANVPVIYFIFWIIMTTYVAGLPKKKLRLNLIWLSNLIKWLD